MQRIAQLALLFLLTGSFAACDSKSQRRDFFQQARQSATLGAPPAPVSPPAPGIEARPAAPTPVTPGRLRPFALRGSGQFVKAGLGPTDRPALAQGVTPATEEFTLNFADADLREVIRAMLQDTLGVNYVIDPTVQGTVTLQTSRPLSRAQILPTLEEILRLNNAAVVEIEGLYRILPAEQAGRAAPNLSFADVRGRGLTVRVVPLRFVSAGEIEELLQSFAPVAGGIRIDRGRNLLFATGTAQELDGLLNLIAVIDVDWLQGMSFALEPLREAEPETVINELTQILDDPDGPKLTGLLRFLPIERMNAILVIAKQPRYLDEALAWIGRLDQGGTDQPRVHVYYVQNRRAADLAELLSQIFGSEGLTVVSPQASLAPGLTPVTLETGEAPPPGEGAASPPAGTAGEGIALGGGAIRVIADEEANALVTLSTAQDYRVVEAALKRLDILPLQVLIEATIAEVRLTEELNFGLRWFFERGNNSLTFSDAVTSTGEAVLGSTFPGFSYAFRSSDVRVTVNALRSITDVNLLSAPSLVVLDNQTASLEVGDQVPVTTRSSVSVTDSDAPAVNEVEFRDTGVILTVTPRVNAGGLVILEIVQEVSDAIETTTSGIDSPTIRQRKLDSTIAVQTGETVALGGLVRDQVREREIGVPILMEIPLLGNLFKSNEDETERTELLVLLKPTVVRNSADARAITDELRRKLPGMFPELFTSPGTEGGVEETGAEEEPTSGT